LELSSASPAASPKARSIPETVIDVRGITKRFFLRPEQRPGSWLDATMQVVASRLRGSGSWVTAVDGVDLQVRRGEILGLLGPNGAGKTTLIKMLCGLLLPSAGDGNVLGFDLIREHPRVRANVSLVAPTADVGTDNNLSVRQNLEFWAFVYAIPANERARRVDELLEVVDLSEVQHVWPMHISAGMRQRLAIARSLLAGNPLVFLDEPTVKLDPEAAQRIRRFVADLRVRYGVTILLTTHYMFEAEELCDRIAIMDSGRIIALDTPVSLKRRLASDQTTELIARGLDPVLADAIRRLPSVTAVDISIDEPAIGGGTIRVRSTDVEAMTNPLLQLLQQHGVEVRGIVSGEPTLEDVFFAIAGRGLA
jgi:ABC-2 type transport system ATP-binding protein